MSWSFFQMNTPFGLFPTIPSVFPTRRWETQTTLLLLYTNQRRALKVKPIVRYLTFALNNWNREHWALPLTRHKENISSFIRILSYFLYVYLTQNLGWCLFLCFKVYNQRVQSILQSHPPSLLSRTTTIERSLPAQVTNTGYSNWW